MHDEARFFEEKLQRLNLQKSIREQTRLRERNTSRTTRETISNNVIIRLMTDAVTYSRINGL